MLLMTMGKIILCTYASNVSIAQVITTADEEAVIYSAIDRMKRFRKNNEKIISIKIKFNFLYKC